jgi:cobalt-zinc-cadmium efflux system outer membrane protein
VLVAQERVRLAQEVVTLVTGLKNTAEALARAGEVPEVDALRAEVELRRAVNRLTLEQAALATATRALALLIGAPPDAPLLATGPLLFEPVPGGLEELLSLARANRPDLSAAQAALEGALAALRLVEAERFLPAIRFSASYGEAVDFDSTNRRGLFGISIPLPLWNRRQGDLRAAEAEIRRQEAQRERILARIDTEVSTAFQQLSAANRVVEEYAQRIVPGQEETARLIQQGYRLGEFRLSDALLAQRDFIETRTGYLEAIAAANAVRAELQRAVAIGP